MNNITIQLKYVRHSARKLRPFLRLVKGKPVQTALNITAVLPNDSAHFIHKAIKMAEAAAIGKEFKTEQLSVQQVMATEGPKIKRIRANAKGRANRYLKHLAHLTVVLSETSPKVKKNAPKTNKSTKETNGS